MNLEKHNRKISDIICGVSVFNVDLAVEMWRYVLQNAQTFIKADGYWYTGSIIDDISRNAGHEKIIDIFKENDDIVEVCFGISSDVYTYSAADLIPFGEVELADRILELIKSNEYKKDYPSFASYLEEACDSFVSDFEEIHSFDEEWGNQEEHDRKVKLASQGSNMLFKWMKTISDREDLARLNVTMIDYL